MKRAHGQRVRATDYTDEENYVLEQHEVIEEGDDYVTMSTRRL